MDMNFLLTGLNQSLFIQEQAFQNHSKQFCLLLFDTSRIFHRQFLCYHRILPGSKYIQNRFKFFYQKHLHQMKNFLPILNIHYNSFFFLGPVLIKVKY
jgi:hypothetical protein